MIGFEEHPVRRPSCRGVSVVWGSSEEAAIGAASADRNLFWELPPRPESVEGA